MSPAVRAHLWRTLIVTALLVGVADAVAASGQFILQTGKSPAPVWRFVASALISPDAAPGPTARMLIGLAMHFAIALGWTALFFLGASRLPALRGNPWVIGTLYGLVVWVLMNRVLVPLTRLGPARPFDPKQAAIGAAILIVCVGIPIVFGARRAFR